VIDTTFDQPGDTNGASGTVVNAILPAPGYSGILDLAIDSASRIVAVGAGNDGSSNHAVVARYLSYGTLDPAFGTDGKVDFADADGTVNFAAVALDAAGRSVVVGKGALPSGEALLAARYSADGTLDPTFGVGGIVESNVLGDIPANDLAILSDGSILVAGMRNGTAGVLRLLSNGTLDATFGGGDGWVTVSVQTNGEKPRMAIQSDGKIVLGMAVLDGAVRRGAAIRLLADGTLDTTFASSGLYRTTVGTTSARITDVAVTADGKIVLVGPADSNGDNDFLVIRLWQ